MNGYISSVMADRFSRIRRLGGLSVIGLMMAICHLPRATAEPVDFNRQVRPILSNYCFECHGPDPSHRRGGARGADGLRLDVREDALRDLGGHGNGQKGGRWAIMPGDPARSEMVRRITSDDPDLLMPPSDHRKHLSEAQKLVLIEWIREGATWSDHWAYIPPARPATPELSKSVEVQPVNFIDHFIADRWVEAKVSAAGEADRRTLIRRLSFDLIGLPPTADEVDAFAADESADAYEKLVDRLLASPHFGERMAVPWLDVVRYADTVGYHGDQEHQAAPYRDWVIRAFNQNMPFDQFTIEQLAGDLLPGATRDQKIASCYNRLIQTTHEGGAQDKEYLAKYVADRVRTTASVWMGATLGCAECHDHKFDPYSQKDFYRFAAFFADVKEWGAYPSPNSSPTTRPPEMELPNEEEAAKLAELASEIKEIEASIKDATFNAEAEDETVADESLQERLKALKNEQATIRRGLPRVMITQAVEPRTMRLLPRGDWMDETGEIVEPGVPHFLEPISTEGRATRLDLARWLTSAENPLTARVFVNRLWRQFFGAGLSRVLDDLGSQGQWPTHPQLLDALAVEFVESGWDVKHMTKLMVMSGTYRRASVPLDEHLVLDPANELFARQARSRLPAEMVRDKALAVSGLLVTEVGSLRSARPYQPEGYYAHLNFPERKYRPDEDAGQYRRGVYMHWQRQFLHPALKAFDAPSREECIAERPSSNTPQQALTLLNDPTFVEAARVFAQRVMREAADESVDSRLRFAFEQLLTREPEARELEVLRGLFAAHLEDYQADPKAARELIGIGMTPPDEALDPAELAAWTSITRTLINLSESITRP